MLGAQVIATPLFGMLADRHGYKSSFQFALLAQACAMILSLSVTTVSGFSFAFALLGAGTGLIFATTLNLVVEFAPATERVTYLGLHGTLIAPATLLAPVIGGWLAHVGGYPLAFIAAAVCGLSALVLLTWFVRDPRHRQLAAAMRPERRHLRQARRWPNSWQALVEICLICAWAAWIGRSLLDFNPYTWPVGGEWGTQLQTHQLWMQARQCGLCALWNGGINGGAPALADLFGSMLHPLVALTTLAWGVVVGAKVALVVALALGGIAQWWIAHVLRLGAAARIWSALLAVAGGHLAGRMENGNFGLVLSTACCSLALAAALDLAIRRERRATLLLALAGASAILSGQGYMQLALLAWTPAFLCFIADPHWRRQASEFLLALALALLLSGIFLIPLLHFWPQVSKDSDPAFRAAQPLLFMPLNLVIADPGLLRASTLGRLPYAYLYNLYIGWLPVLLALLAFPLAWRQRRQQFCS